MTVVLLLAAAVAAGWVAVTAKRESRRARPQDSVEDFHRALDALSHGSERTRRR